MTEVYELSLRIDGPALAARSWLPELHPANLTQRKVARWQCPTSERMLPCAYHAIWIAEQAALASADTCGRLCHVSTTTTLGQQVVNIPEAQGKWKI